jgi:excisionase family DNA binding protein
MKLLSAEDAADRLGVSSRRVRQLIEEGKLAAQYVGGGYVIEESALDKVRVYGKPGRPPNAKPDNGAKATKKRGK